MLLALWCGWMDGWMNKSPTISANSTTHILRKGSGSKTQGFLYQSWECSNATIFIWSWWTSSPYCSASIIRFALMDPAAEEMPCNCGKLSSANKTVLLWRRQRRATQNWKKKDQTPDSCRCNTLKTGREAAAWFACPWCCLESHRSSQNSKELWGETAWAETAQRTLKPLREQLSAQTRAVLHVVSEHTALL